MTGRPWASRTASRSVASSARRGSAGGDAILKDYLRHHDEAASVAVVVLAWSRLLYVEFIRRSDATVTDRETRRNSAPRLTGRV